MLLLAVASIVASRPPARVQPLVVREATARVRIISGVRLKLDSRVNPDAPDAHDSQVTADGSLRPARLIEFE